MPSVIKRPIRRGLRPLRKRVTLPVPPAQRVWLMRKRNWIEVRLSEKRPKRIISRIVVGGTPLVGYGWEGGEHVGVLFYSSYVGVGHGPTRRTMALPEIRHGQMLLLEGELTEMILNVKTRKLVFGG